MPKKPKIGAPKISKSVFLAMAFALGLWLFGYFAVQPYPDAYFLSNALRCGYDCVDGFRFPLLFYVSYPLWQVFGEQVFVFLPLTFFLVGFAFLSKLFLEFKIKQVWLIFLFAIIFKSIWWIGQYTRNSLTFTISAIFAYYFAKSWFKKEEHWLTIFFVSFIGLFANPQHLVFLPLLALLVLKNRKSFFALLDGNIKNFFVLIAIIVLPAIPLVLFLLFGTYTGLNDSANQIVVAIGFLLHLNLNNSKAFLLAFSNYLFFVGIAFGIIKKDWLLLLVVFLSVLVGGLSGYGFIGGQTGMDNIIFRYGFVLTPLLIFLLARHFSTLFVATKKP